MFADRFERDGYLIFDRLFYPQLIDLIPVTTICATPTMATSRHGKRSSQAKPSARSISHFLPARSRR
jgi:hypothetical protein